MKKTLYKISLASLLLCNFAYAQKITEDKQNDQKIVSSLSLNQISVKEAARLISIATGKSIVVSGDAAKTIVDLHLTDVTAQMALEAVCRAAGLWYQQNSDDAFIHVMTIEEFKGTLQFSREEKVEVVQILYPLAKDIGDALAKLYVNRVIWIDPKKNSGDRYSEIGRALRRMDLLGKRGTFDITDKEESTNDINEDNEERSSNNSTYKNEAAKAEKLDISQINSGKISNLNNQKEVQYHDLANNPGIVFISVLPENNSLMLRSSDPSAIKQIMEIIAKLDKPTPQILLEVKVLTVELENTNERAVDFLFGSDSGNVSGGFSNGLLSTEGQTILRPDINLIAQGTGINPQAAIFNAVSKNFRARIQLLERNERVTQLATPNLLVSNNESSTLFIGTETTVMEKAQSTTTYTEISSGTFQPNISWNIEAPRRKIGTSLLLTPKIHADRTVTLNLLQEQSTLGSQIRNTYSGGVKSSTTEEQYFISQDINLQRLITTVVGRDRDFMIIGGLINEEDVATTEKTPLLADIPIIGEWLFTRRSTTKVRKELIIIIRPFVMLAPGESQAVSISYLKRMSQHPTAKEDLPNLGINMDKEKKAKTIDKNDPWLRRMTDNLEIWKVENSLPSNKQENNNTEGENKNEN